MRHNDTSNSTVFYGSYNLKFRFCIQRRSGLVKNDDGRILGQNTGNLHSLPLAARKVLATLGDFVTVTPVTLHNILMELRIPRSHDDLKILYRIIPHFDIVCNCILKQNNILIHYRQRSGKNTSVNFFYRLSIK